MIEVRAVQSGRSLAARACTCRADGHQPPRGQSCARHIGSRRAHRAPAGPRHAHLRCARQRGRFELLNSRSSPIPSIRSKPAWRSSRPWRDSRRFAARRPISTSYSRSAEASRLLRIRYPTRRRTPPSTGASRPRRAIPSSHYFRGAAACRVRPLVASRTRDRSLHQQSGAIRGRAP